MKIEITFAGLPKSPNRRMSMHWRAKGREVKAWRTKAAWVARAHPDRPEEPWRLVELTLIRGASRMCDIDNHISSFKALIDGLVDAGIILDDNPNVVRAIRCEHIPTKRDATYVKIIVHKFL